jgi:hypothetical protein
MAKEGERVEGKKQQAMSARESRGPRRQQPLFKNCFCGHLDESSNEGGALNCKNIHALN